MQMIRGRMLRSTISSKLATRTTSQAAVEIGFSRGIGHDAFIFEINVKRRMSGRLAFPVAILCESQVSRLGVCPIEPVVEVNNCGCGLMDMRRALVWSRTGFCQAIVAIWWHASNWC